MANFWSGFNQGFQPYGTRAADLISRTILNNKARDKDFYNQLALQDNKGKNALDVQRQKLFAEQEKIIQSKKEHLKAQKDIESLLVNYNEEKYAQLPKDYQLKYNRIIGNRDKDNSQYSEDDFIDASQVEGLRHLKGHQVKRTRKYKGDKLIDLSYGQPFTKADKVRPKTDSNIEALSKVEKNYKNSIEKSLIQYEQQIATAETYGAVSVDGEPLSKSEIQSNFVETKKNMISGVKNLIGKKNLKYYDSSFNQFRPNGENPQQLSEKDFAGYVTSVYENITEAYKNEDITEADLQLYDLLIRLDTGLNLKEIKGVLDAR